MYSRGAGIQYLIPASDANFPLTPSGPLYTGSGSNRVKILPASLGTLSRNAVRAPGYFNLDLSVARNFKLRERVALQLRADAFNALNHTNFNPPSTSLTVSTSGSQAIFNSSSFGLITSAASARFMQLVARITF
jgi:hypothetical protein